MSNEIATNESFQERMFKRVREQMGDLMTNDELKKIVDTAMQKAFFEERRDNSGYNTKYLPPLFVEMIEKEVSTQVRSAVIDWLKEHPEDVTKAIDEALAKGFFELVQQHMQNQIRQPLYQFAEQLRQKGVLI
jgi:pyruvate-formate lyase